MRDGKETLYDVLDLPRNAPPSDVEKAYKRRREETEAKGANPRAIALIREAHEVLSNAERRAAYDKSLREDSFDAAPDARRIPWKLIGYGVLAFGGAIGAYFMFRAPPPPPPSKAEEILRGASDSTARLQNLDVGGNASPVGLAAMVDDRTLITTCHGIRGGQQLVIDNGKTKVPARVSLADVHFDLCKVDVDTVRKPFRLGDGVKAGDKVYALGLRADGEFTVTDGEVVGLVPTPKGNVIETTIPVHFAASGGPLIDAYGKLVGFTTSPHSYGQGRNMALPVAWVKEMRSRTTDAAPPPPASPPAKKKVR
jgi:S1-C subfamily serine protease